MMAQGMDGRVGSKDQAVQSKIFLGPKAPAKGTKTGPRGERRVLPFLRDHPYLGLPLHPPYLPSSGNNSPP